MVEEEESENVVTDFKCPKNGQILQNLRRFEACYVFRPAAMEKTTRVLLKEYLGISSIKNILELLKDEQPKGQEIAFYPVGIPMSPD